MVKQLSLFNQPSLNVDKDIKVALADAARKCRYSREELLDRINALADRYGVRLTKGRGQKLTMATFEKWLNPEAMEYQPRPAVLNILCVAMEDFEPIKAQVDPMGMMLIDEADVKLLLWAKEYHRAKDARSKMRKLEMEL